MVETQPIALRCRRTELLGQMLSRIWRTISGFADVEIVDERRDRQCSAGPDGVGTRFRAVVRLGARVDGTG